MDKTKLLSLGFLGFSVVYLAMIALGYEDAAWYLKPFLMPFLIGLAYAQGYIFKRGLLLAALAFSWLGDVLLMFVHKMPDIFIGGLLAFLVAHLCYIRLFSYKTGLIEIKEAHKSKIWIGIVALAVFLATMLYFLLPHTGALKIPVTVYALTITTMAYAAWRRFTYDDRHGNTYVLLGALFFVASDSILAFNKFHSPIPKASLFIMFTYIAAQYFIVRGIAEPNR